MVGLQSGWNGVRPEALAAVRTRTPALALLASSADTSPPTTQAKHNDRPNLVAAELIPTSREVAFRRQGKRLRSSLRQRDWAIDETYAPASAKQPLPTGRPTALRRGSTYHDR